MDLPWRWCYLYQNKSITPEIINSNPEYLLKDCHFRYEWIVYLDSPNITINFIKNNIWKNSDLYIITNQYNNCDKDMLISSLCGIDFKKDKDIFLNKKRREYMAAYKIQQWWYMITLSPYYKIGKKFIEKRRQELF